MVLKFQSDCVKKPTQRTIAVRTMGIMFAIFVKNGSKKEQPETDQDNTHNDCAARDL